MHDGGGGSRATTTEAGGGVADTRTGLSDADSDGAGLAMEIESGAALVGSESRADVAPKDESAGTAVDRKVAEAMQMIEELRIQSRVRDESDRPITEGVLGRCGSA